MSHSISIDVKNGKVVRIRPLHYEDFADWSTLTPWKIEARGKVFEPRKRAIIPPYLLGYKKRVYSPNRIVYPLQRVDWEPGGDPAKINPQNRGKSKFKRISWDQATTIIANEITRIRAKYGKYAIMTQGDGHGESKNITFKHSAKDIVLQIADCRTTMLRNPDSWEGWNWGAMHVWGQDTHGKMKDHTNVWVDALRNSEMILMWGCDAETTPWGWGLDCSSRLTYWLQQVGIKLVHISPDLNYNNAAHPDKWIPVLPNTDPALHLAIAYTWISENIFDQAFVTDSKYCVGFDKYKAYVMGESDGVPKSPAWASPRCGVPDYTIKALARQWSKKVTSQAISNGGSHIRGPFSTEPARMMVYNMAMQGLGKPGVYQLSYIEGGVNGMPRSLWNKWSGNTRGGVRASAPTAAQKFPKTMIGDCIMHPPQSWYGLGGAMGGTRDDQFVKYTYPLPDGGGRIAGIWMDGPCMTSNWQCGTYTAKAYRDPSIEFIMGNHPWFEDDLLYADIILPEDTSIEEKDVRAEASSGNMTVIHYMKGAVKPIGESMPQYEIGHAIAKALGKEADYTQNLTYDDRMKLCWSGTDTVASNWKDKITWEDFTKKGAFVVPADPDWEKRGGTTTVLGGLNAWRADPVKNPLGTKTGKFEFECQDLLEAFPDDRERPPLAHYITGGPDWWHDESLYGERAKKYTMLVITNHPRWRLHSQHDDNTWLREIQTCKVTGPDGYKYEPAWLNPVDAAKRNIVTGDIVKIFNERGTILAGAIVMERVIAGAVYIDHGARLDEIIPTQLDRGGSINMICTIHGVSQNCNAGECTSGYLVEVAKVTGDEYETWRRQYPEVFTRPYDSAAGLRLSAWVEGETL